MKTRSFVSPDIANGLLKSADIVIEAKLPLVLATLISLWAIVYYALALRRVYFGTWLQTIWRGALLTMLYFLTVLAIGLLVTAAMLPF